MAGFVVDGVQLRRLNDEMQSFMKWGVSPKFGIPWETELHGNEIMQGKKGWKCLRGNTGEAIWVYREVLSILNPVGARTFVQGVDTDRLYARYREQAQSPYLIALRHALERIDAYASAWKYDRVQVVADYVDDQNIYHQAITGYKQNGTPGYQRSKLTRTSEPISFEDSKDSYGLQMADLIAHISRRHLDANSSASYRSVREAAKLYQYVWDQIADQNRRRTKWVP